MAAIVHLIRHGEVANPKGVVYASLPGFGLSDRGRSQARAAARHLQNRPVVAVWSSPLQRALDTAGIIARQFGIPVSIDEGLGEWTLLDRWAGTPWSELPQRFPGELEQYLEAPTSITGRETLTQLARRIAGTVERIVAVHPAGEVVVVSHQDPIQAVRLLLTGGDLATLHTDKPGHASVTTLRPGRPWEEVWTMNPEATESTSEAGLESDTSGNEGQSAAGSGAPAEGGEQLDVGGEGQLW